MDAKTYLTQQVKGHESYIRSAGISIRRGEYGDYDGAEWELIESGEMADTLDRWEFDAETPWFVSLVQRQARCNAYQ